MPISYFLPYKDGMQLEYYLYGMCMEVYGSCIVGEYCVINR